MEYIILLFLIQYSIFYANALIGHNIEEIGIGEYSIVACLVKNPIYDLKLSRLCTGTFISNSHILTAEHCFHDIEEDGFIVYAGSNKLDQSIIYYPRWLISYDQWSTACKLDITYPQNDISIVKATGPQSNSMRLLDVFELRPFSLLYGYKLDIVGCGLNNEGFYTMTKLKASLKVLSSQECENRIERIHGNRLLLTERIMCTAGEPYTLLGDADSGSPVFYYNHLVAVSLSICPVIEDVFNPARVNLHLIVSFYKNFMNEMLKV